MPARPASAVIETVTVASMWRAARRAIEAAKPAKKNGGHGPAVLVERFTVSGKRRHDYSALAASASAGAAVAAAAAAAASSWAFFSSAARSCAFLPGRA